MRLRRNCDVGLANCFMSENEGFFVFVHIVLSGMDIKMMADEVWVATAGASWKWKEVSSEVEELRSLLRDGKKYVVGLNRRCVQRNWRLHGPVVKTEKKVVHHKHEGVVFGTKQCDRSREPGE